MDEERFVAAARSSAREKGGAKGRMRLHRARGSVELRKVAFSSATQVLWLGDKKVGSQVIDKD